MNKPSDRWPTSSEVTDLVGEIRRVCLEENERIYLMALQVVSVLEGRATYADTLAVLATIVNKLQEDDDLARGVCVFALGATCGVPVKRVNDQGQVDDPFAAPTPPPPARKTVARGHLRLVKPDSEVH